MAVLGGERFSLTGREFDLLVHLVSHAGEAFSRERLMREVWEWDFGDTSMVTVQVRRLREKVEADPGAPKRLVTASGVIAVILAFYGVYFLLALPLVRLRARTLAIIAAVLAAVAPQAAFGVSSLLLSGDVVDRINAYDPLERLGGNGLLSLLLNGFYPASTWMPFVIAGMALGRLDLAARAVQRRL
ncbi:MAG TPA: helix-turn-helix domain-containing protein, partial [Kineosporiaceae bacterium]